MARSQTRNPDSSAFSHESSQRLSKNWGKEALLRLKGLCSQLYATHTVVLFLTSMTR